MISSVNVALDVLRLVADHPGHGLSELARRSEINKSRVYRILTTLVEAGYVHQGADGGYRLGYQALILGQAARRQFDIVAALDAAVADLAEEFDENIQLRIRDGREFVQIYSRTCTQVLRVESAAGNRRPLGVGASGRLLLAYAPQDIIDEVLAGPAAPLLDSETLAGIRETRVSNSRGELTPGVGAVAVPIIDSRGRCSACLSASVPLVRLTENYALALTAALTDVAERLARVLGEQQQTTGDTSHG